MQLNDTNSVLKELNLTESFYLNPSDAVFRMENGFLTMTLPTASYRRVTLHRSFPFARPEDYLSVLDGDGKEVGMIHSISEFSQDQKILLREELAREYYMPEILEIHSMKERYGFSYWQVETADGMVRFTLQDTYRSILHVSETHLILLDVDGNRFEIPNVRKLSRSAQKKLELYL